MNALQNYRRYTYATTQHKDRLKKIPGSEIYGNFGRTSWALLQKKQNEKLADYADWCEAGVRLRKEIAAYRRVFPKFCLPERNLYSPVGS